VVLSSPLAERRDELLLFSSSIETRISFVN